MQVKGYFLESSMINLQLQFYNYNNSTTTTTTKEFPVKRMKHCQYQEWEIKGQQYQQH